MNGFDISTISSVYVGSTQYGSIYKGSNLLWPINQQLPYDAEVEYLESTGTLYIDLNFYPNSTTHVIIDAQLNDIDTYYDGAGTIGVSVRNRFLICNVYNGYFHFGCGYQWSNVMQADTNRHIFLLWGDGNCAIDNQNYLIDENCDFSLSVDSFYLFAKNRESKYIDYGAIKIYSCKIYNNDTLVKDIIPVRVGQVGYIYDKISKQLFGNQGTGDFILGPDKSDYVTDGLIFHLDGINKGVGSDWTDLINNVLFVANNCTSTINSYLLAGSSDSYLIGSRSSLIGSNNLTVEVCYYNTSTNNAYFIFGSGGSSYSGYPLFYKESSNITWSLGQHVYDGSSIQNNSKYTISLNNDCGFVNGNSITMKSSTDYWDRDHGSIRIGHASSGGAAENPFCGHIYSIRIYNRRLTQAEQLLNQRIDNLRFNLGLLI